VTNEKHHEKFGGIKIGLKNSEKQEKGREGW
jgi:hypothetical protein